MSRRIVPALTAAGSFVLFLALLIRFSVRDRLAISAGLFYATPWPVLALGALLLAVLWQYQGHRVAGRGLALFAMVALSTWCAGSCRLHPAPAAPGELRVVLWNVSRPTRGLPAVARWLRAQEADVIVLAEGYKAGGTALARWRQELPGFDAVELPAEMTCLVRGRILPEAEHPAVKELSYGLLHAEIRGRAITLLLVDISPSFSKPRRRALNELTTLAHAHRAENLIVLGDFNTPRESVLLDPLRGEMAHAFESGGRGFAETWPMPFPVLSLDQIWTSPRLRAVRCVHGHSLRSDHRAVVADFTFADP